MFLKNKLVPSAAALLLCAGLSGQAFAHGDVTPQGVDTEGLEQLGDEWRDENPYRAPYENNELAVKIGSSAYNQNCARCHGLEGISGGIAPDLRMLDPGYDGDEWYQYRVVNGAVRDGKVYMPKMADYISQEGLWAIRTYLESLPVDE
ncbi:cytochrome c-550 PedF [Neptunomonas phycophila]|jgi:cytochrome c-550 PedF|uniref:Cytochrome c-550 PedF n=1 Tax=Neptunomonas phycophila TaxID=1572645 RepID=A0AAW7XL20_9GAMM|nr:MULTISPECIES: cytochrome c-550 PedF [Neptunomonas]MDN2659161.1 cytochrome c-550 PedF [Neptunomonas sp. CHC150]MDO6453540.1 cytochrome c-550 PedF [Neptunomonas phycophila]MDO6468308.1 cytochrome c-550 PedF [Neptunomonas phycophila]MDP2522317.1 cytochrome c-550 PedF [Neptunomonas phycophila]QLE98955.1 cytochrome c-550 PedF [Neptunomonas phycophila]